MTTREVVSAILNRNQIPVGDRSAYWGTPMKALTISLLAFAVCVLVTGCSSSSSPAAPAQVSSLPPPGSGNGVVNFRNASNGLTFHQVCLAAAGTYDPSHNGNRVPIPSGSPVCTSGQIAVGTNFQIGGDSDARFTPGPTSLIVDGAIFAVTVSTGTTNFVYPTLQ